MRERIRVQVFSKPRWVETVSCDGKPCGKGGGGCSADPAPRTGGNCQSESCGGAHSCEPGDVLTSLAGAHPDLMDVEIADYSSLVSIRRSLHDLNEILERNGETPFLTLENFESVFSQVSPFIAFDGELAFVGTTPSAAELVESIRTWRSQGLMNATT